MGGVGCPREVRQVQPFDEGGVPGDGLVPVPRIVNAQGRSDAQA